MLFVLLPFGGFWFYAIFSVLIALVAYEAFFEHGAKATSYVAGALVLLALFTNVPVLHWLKNLTWMEGLKIFGGYFGIGFIYMCFKWTYESYETMLSYSSYREAWLKVRGLKEMPKGDEIVTGKAVLSSPTPNQTPVSYAFSDFIESLWKEKKIKFNDLPPRISNHKSDMIFWLTYWHISLISTLFGQVFDRIVQLVIKWTTKPLNAISRAMFGKFSEFK